MQGLSHRENQVYNLICQHWSKKTCAPPMRWIAKELHLKSKGYIHKIIHSLIDKGYLTMVPGKPRTIRPLKFISNFHKKVLDEPVKTPQYGKLQR